jgi:hypothetical protein
MASIKGTGRRAAGRFQTRDELTCHVWAMRRQQVFLNNRAIAGACGVTIEVVKTILETEEGLGQYLKSGCPTG